MERLLVTGATTPLGRMLVQHLQDEPGVKKVIGVEPRSTTDWLDGVELVAFEPDDGELVSFLADQAVDTVIHLLAPSRTGDPEVSGPADVIDCMRLCAAVGSPRAHVRSLVLVSSSEVYPIDSHAPLMHREQDLVGDVVSEAAEALLEAEDFARDVAERLSHVNVSILRLAELMGGKLGGALSAVLAQSRPPQLIGFDPQVQWLHALDAVEAIRFAARLELAGVYNVASDGVIRWSEALAARGRPVTPVLPFEVWPLTALLRSAGLPHLPDGMGNHLRSGSAVDTAKLRAAGWQPRFDQWQCAAGSES